CRRIRSLFHLTSFCSNSGSDGGPHERNNRAQCRWVSRLTRCGGEERSETSWLSLPSRLCGPAENRAPSPPGSSTCWSTHCTSTSLLCVCAIRRGCRGPPSVKTTVAGFGYMQVSNQRRSAVFRPCAKHYASQ